MNWHVMLEYVGLFTVCAVAASLVALALRGLFTIM